MREHEIYGANAGVDDHQPPDAFTGGGHEEHQAVHRALSQLEGVASHIMDRTAMGIFTAEMGDIPQRSNTQSRSVNSLRRRGGGEAFSINGVHRGKRPGGVRKVSMFKHSVCTGLSKPNLLGVKVLY